MSVSRSIFALTDDRDRAYFGGARAEADQIGYIDENTRAMFGRSYAGEPDKLVEELRKDEAIAEADTLLFTVPNQLGVAYNAHVIEAILDPHRTHARLAVRSGAGSTCDQAAAGSDIATCPFEPANPARHPVSVPPSFAARPRWPSAAGSSP